MGRGAETWKDGMGGSGHGVGACAGFESVRGNGAAVRAAIEICMRSRSGK